MKICIVSDSHDRADPLAASVQQAQEAGAQAVIHCGDLIGANTLRASMKFGMTMHLVHGNNLNDAMAMHRMMAKSDEALISWAGCRVGTRRQAPHLCNPLPALWPRHGLYRGLRSGLLWPQPCRGDHPATQHQGRTDVTSQPGVGFRYRHPQREGSIHLDIG